MNKQSKIKKNYLKIDSVMCDFHIANPKNL